MGQQANSIFTLSVTATTPIVAYRGVDFNGAQTAAIGAKIIGIAKRGAAVGHEFEVACVGTATCEAGAAFAKGVALVMNPLGQVVAASFLGALAPVSTLAVGVGTLAVAAGAIPVTSAAVNGAGTITGAPALTGAIAAPVFFGGDLPQFVIGHALEAAVNVGDFVEVLLCR